MLLRHDLELLFFKSKKSLTVFLIQFCVITSQLKEVLQFFFFKFVKTMSKIFVDITSSSFITLEMEGNIALWDKNPVQCTLSPAHLDKCNWLSRYCMHIWVVYQ